MFRRILVPLDGSSFGEHALPYAMSIARRAGAQIELIHVHDPSEERESSEYSQGDRQEGEIRTREYLESVAKTIHTLSGVACEVTLREGKIAASILAHAAVSNTDMVVLTTHGLGPLSRFWLGSVADAIIRSAEIPVLVIRPDEEDPDLSNEVRLHRVLIPLDGSVLAEQILQPAMAIGSLMEAQYQLLRVVRPARELGPDALVSPAVHVPDEEAVSRARAYLVRVRNRIVGKKAVKMRVVAESNANVAQTIIDIGNANMFDLIALATHGRSGLLRLILGSVADKVVRGASVPVLVYRPSA